MFRRRCAGDVNLVTVWIPDELLEQILAVADGDLSGYFAMLVQRDIMRDRVVFSRRGRRFRAG